MVPFRAGRRPAFLVNDPSLAEIVLSSREAEYENPYHQYRELAGHYSSAGAFVTSTLPRGASPRDAAEALARVLGEETHRAIDEWLARGRVRLEIAAKVLTFNAATRALFGVSLREQAEAFVRATDLLEECWIEGGTSPEAEEALRLQTEVVDAIARAASLTGSRGQVSQKTRTAILRTILNAYNATGTSLTWTLEVLGRHGDVREPLRQVVLEVLRLYPPAWNLGRTALATHRLGSALVEKGTLLFVSPYAMHRHRSLWEEPSEFRPSRFTAPPRHPFAYLPFGGGTRRCPASHVIVRHLQTMVATVLERADIRTISPAAAPRGLVALRPSSVVILELQSAPCAV